MTQKKPLTGPELEALGLMKFTCDTCREIFPARCDDHRILVVFEGNHAPPAQNAQLRLDLRLELHQQRRILAFGQPIAGYTAPYEMLEADIDRVLREAARQ